LIFDRVKQVGAVSGTRNTMRFVGINDQTKLFAGFDQSFKKLDAVL
jgi:hypothetical protein